MLRNINPKVFPIIIVGLFILGISLFSYPDALGEGLFTISFLDIGQGDATLIEGPNDNQILIDGGPDKAILSELGQVMSPFDRKIEHVIITHPHSDHIAGLNYLLDRYEVGQIYMTGQDYFSPDYDLLLTKIEERGVSVKQFLIKDSFSFEGAKVQCFWPSASELRNPEDANDGSVVVGFEFNQTKWLLLGDLGEEKQEKMMAVSEEFPNYEIVKVAHHGSKTGISKALIREAKPVFAVISVGKDNSYGHPAKTTINRLLSSRILRTDILGTIKLSTDGKNTLLLN